MSATVHNQIFSWADKEKSHLVAVHFEYIDRVAESVCLAGTFNDWHPCATPMARFRSLGIWVKDLELPTGTYEYNFVVDGRWKHDPASREMVESMAGRLNSVLHVKERNTNGEI